MVIFFEKSGTREDLIRDCREAALNEDVKALLILACDDNGFTPDNLNGELQQIRLPIFGGIFPAIIHQNKKYERGTLVLGLSQEPILHTIPDLSSAGTDFEAVIDQMIPDTDDSRSMIVLVDGLAKRIGSLIEGLFNNFGLELNYIGGGAGSLSMVPKPCLFNNHGLVKDQAVIALLTADSGVGVCHGWEPLSGPYQITESNQNMIVSIDFQPAFDIYRRAVQPYLNQEITIENFFSLAKSHPFGLAKLGAEKLVRDPIAVTPEGAIQCVGEVPQGSYVHILSGSIQSLVGAAKTAMVNAYRRYPGKPESTTGLLIDCISRVLFLKDEFQQELDAVQAPNAPLVGALTLGEIGCSGQDYLEFYNKTCVVGVVDL